MTNVLRKAMDIMGFNDYEDDNDDDKDKKVVPIHRDVTLVGPIIELMAPTEFEDAKYLGDKLKNKTIVALNLTKVDSIIAERILDFAIGVTYALGGGSLKLDSKVFLLTGSGVTLK